MRVFLPILHLAAGLAFSLATAAAGSPTTLPAAVEAHTLTFEAHGNGRDQLTLVLKNPSPVPITVTIPAGQIAAGSRGENRVIVLCEATATVPSGGAVEVSLPVVALSAKNSASPQAFTLQAGAEPRLAGLLKVLADQPDAPRPTVQLAVLSLLEDMTYAQWRQFSGAAKDAPPTPAEVTQAVDALGLIRQAAPQGTFALANDSELKLRALRNPWSRGKAMALYGIDAGIEAAPPDLRQLLHTQAGDNCPICRQRALMQKPAEIP